MKSVYATPTLMRYTQKSQKKYSVARSKSYISLSTLLTIIPCYTGHVYTPKAFDALLIKLRLRRLQPNLPYSLSSHSRVDMALQSGPTIHFCFPYISKSNGWQIQGKPDSGIGKRV